MKKLLSMLLVLALAITLIDIPVKASATKLPLITDCLIKQSISGSEPSIKTEKT